MDGCTFKRNRAGEQGGGMRIDESSGIFTRTLEHVYLVTNWFTELKAAVGN